MSTYSGHVAADAYEAGVDAGGSDPAFAAEPGLDQIDVGWARTVAFVLRCAHKMLLLAIAGGTIAALVAALWPASYTVTSSFYPVAPNSDLSALSRLASQFGVGAVTTSPQSTPDFFQTLLTSDVVLESVASKRYRFNHDGKRYDGDLVRLWDIDEGSQGKSLMEAVSELQDAMSISTDETTGIVQFSVQTKWAPLSLEISQALLATIDSVNQAAYTTTAEQQRRFIQENLDALSAELHAAEDALKAFIEANRVYTNDPALVIEYQRLQRRIDLTTSAYTTLDQSYEQARMEAVRNTPAISILVRPAVPVDEDERHVGLKTVLGVFLGLLLGLAVGGFQEFARRESRDHPVAMARLRDVAVDERRSLLRMIIWRRRAGH